MKRCTSAVWRRGRSRTVTTWSPLATAFNTRPNTTPLLNSFKQGNGLFNKPELTHHEGFYILKERAIAATDELIAEATSGNSSRPIVDIFDELSDTLCKVADLAEFVRVAHPQRHYAEAAEDACISISGVVEKLNTHKGLYKALRNAVNNGTSGDQHLAELFLFDFEQSGIHLEERSRQRVVELNELILQTGQRFMTGASKPRLVKREAIPANVRQYFSSMEGGKVSVSGVQAECPSSQAREVAYRLYLTPDKEQDALLDMTLSARRELATLCGFDTYADRAIKASTMETAKNVNDFLDILSDRLHDAAALDFRAMLDMKVQEEPYRSELMCWDTPYFTHKAKSQLLDVDGDDYSPYLSLGACMEGLNILCQELFGITLRPEETAPGELWAPDVCKLGAVHESEGLLGYIYCDLYARPGKPQQDCHFTIQGGKRLPDGSYQTPSVVVQLSLRARRGAPALLSRAALDNLFHEAGHALHSMLARPPYQHVAGTRAPTDLAELPAVLFERFAAEPSLLRRFAAHFQTGAAMPERTLRRLCASRHVFAASEMQLQLFYSALDQRYHGAERLPAGATAAALRDAQRRYYGLPYVERTAWQHRFSHLVGYGAKYYSYLISRAAAWTIYKEHFLERGPSRAAGERLRRGVLASGGSVPPQPLLASFLGAPLTPSSLAGALQDDLAFHADALHSVTAH